MDVDRLQKMAQELLGGGDELSTSLYLLRPGSGDSPAHPISRVGGKAIGIREESWPQFDDEPMEHVLTLDLETTPNLRTGALENARAVALFVSDSTFNEAFEPGTSESAVVLLSQEDLERGELEEEPKTSQILPGTFEVFPIEVPSVILDPEFFGDGSHPASSLWEAVINGSSHADGGPLWLQSPEHEGGQFLFQFDESLVDMNLGDAGVMYVFADTAFWQCH